MQYCGVYLIKVYSKIKKACLLLSLLIYSVENILRSIELASGHLASIAISDTHCVMAEGVQLIKFSLLAAAKRGSLVVVRALLFHPSCDLLARDEEGNTALHIAASRGHHEVVLELASRYSMPTEEASVGINNDGQTSLHLACSKGWIKCVDPLAIKFPSEMDVKDSSGNVPLMTASLAGHDDIVSLLQRRCKVKFESENAKLPINQEKNVTKSLEEIITDKSRLSVTKESSCLLAAAKRGSLAVVRALLSHPSCDLLARDEEGNIALHISASRGHHEVVLELASRYSTPSAGKKMKLHSTWLALEVG